MSDQTSRRDFMKNTAAGLTAASALGAGVGSLDVPSANAAAKTAGKAAANKSETLVAQLYKTLTADQKKVMAFPFDHALRQEIENNWSITKSRVGRDFDKDQQAMIHEIFMKLHSTEYADKVLHQVKSDSGSKGLETCSVAMFGNPGTGKFEFVITGRHMTRRCDGDSVDGTAFGGPIFYGHASRGFNEKPNHPGNVYWYQAKRANEVFQMLDGKQRKQALLGRGREEDGRHTVEFRTKKELEGLAVGDLSKDQKAHVVKVINDVPFAIS